MKCYTDNYVSCGKEGRAVALHAEITINQYLFQLGILTRWLNFSGINDSIHMTTPLNRGCLLPARVLDLAVHVSVVHAVKVQSLICSSLALVSSLPHLFSQLRQAVFSLRVCCWGLTVS